ncbi:MAG: NADP-dependent malic enzyme [Armatimonadetes bacterium]|nr:NADP-dependent malic enzyme [Armatimonadota bacterium]
MVFADGISYRRKYRGLIGIRPKVPIPDKEALSLIYTPGVAQPCRAIAADHLLSYDYTIRSNTVAIVSDGSSVYGLGNAGPLAAVPMLEAKSVFLKTFAGIDGFPLAIDTQDVDEFVETIRYLSPTFGGVYIEDISPPRCFAIEEQCKRAVSLPLFHADQQGTAVVVLAALRNALSLVGKRLDQVRIVINGAGTAGIAVARMLRRMGAGDLKLCDRQGVLYYGRPRGLNWMKSEIARLTNPESRTGKLGDLLAGADVFIGLSAAGLVSPDMVGSMACDPIVFALALSEPEIGVEEALAAGARVVATGRSDYPNQVNCTQSVPGIFRGSLDVRATEINHQMFVAASEAIASLVPPSQLSVERIIPEALDLRVSAVVARAVARAAMDSGTALIAVDPDEVERRVMTYVYEGTNAWVEPACHRHRELTPDQESVELHRRYHGMLEVRAHVPIRDHHIYDLIYSAPDAAIPCALVRDHPEEVYNITCKNNLVAVVTDGTAVLGLGDIGPQAGMPVMEGKAVLFKTFGGVEAFPICLRTQEVDEIVATVKRIAPVFGGINLEDIAAPRCFEIEQKLSSQLSIPVFHDDQHGTAVVVLAALLNATRLTGKPLANLRCVVSGAGAAALAVSRLLLRSGVGSLLICDSQGALYEGRDGMNPYKQEIARITNQDRVSGTLEAVLRGADMFLGLSVPGVLTGEMVKTMASDPLVFALANPVPEIVPEEAHRAGARVVATGRSDLPNQVNNSLAFPGIFRGALDVRARCINEDMKVAAAEAIAGLISDEELAEDCIIPGAFDFRVPPAVAAAVARSAMKTGVARKQVDPDEIAENLRNYLYEGQLHRVAEQEMVG